MIQFKRVSGPEGARFAGDAASAHAHRQRNGPIPCEASDIVSSMTSRFQRIEALNHALGPSGAMRFLGMINRDPTNYVEESRRIYQGQTVDEIFARAQEQWPKTG